MWFVCFSSHLIYKEIKWLRGKREKKERTDEMSIQWTNGCSRKLRGSIPNKHPLRHLV